MFLKIPCCSDFKVRKFLEFQTISRNYAINELGTDWHIQSNMKLIWLVLLVSECLCLRNSGSVVGTPLSLEWEMNDGYLDIEFHSKKLMFIPILLNSRMAESDVWLCSKQKSKWEVDDYWSTGHKVPVVDHKMNGSQDLMHTNINVSEDEVRCGFRRKLLTDDPYDIQLRPNQTLTICSQESDTLNMTKHKTMHDVFCFNWTVAQGVINHQFKPTRLKPSPNIKLIHGIVLTIGWGLFIDLGILVVRYFRTLKYYKLAHVLIFISVNFSSIPFIVMLIVREQKPIFHFFSSMSLAKQIHTILGFATLILLILQHIIGMLAQEFQEHDTAKAKKYRILQLSHKIIGYFLYLITKIQVINGWWIYKQSKTLVMFIMGIWCVLLFLAFATMEHLYKSGKLQIILDSFQRRGKRQSETPSISDQNMVLNESLIVADNLVIDILSGSRRADMLKMYPGRNYYFFKDMICELKDFSHPGANSLTNETVGKDVTKYVYGMAPLEGNMTRSFEHSAYTVSLLTQNSIGRYCQNLCQLDDAAGWRIQSKRQISQGVFRMVIRNNSFSIRLFLENPQKYLGKYWLVTTANATRAYTLLLCESDQNIQYRTSLIQYIKSNFKERVESISNDMTNQITCIIKKYQKGIVSREIHEKRGIQRIEGLYGVPLDIREGVNIILTGGTGLLPFLDLFDSLLKKVIYLAAKQSGQTDTIPPHLSQYQNLHRSCRFKLYSSFKNIEQLHHHSWLVTLHQLSLQHNLNLFQMHIRECEYQGIPSYQGRIDENFFYQMELRGQEFSKVLCCGTPEMNHQIYQSVLALGYHQDILTIV